MLSNNDLYTKLRTVSKRHDELEKQFKAFSDSVHSIMTPEQFPIPNIEFRQDIPVADSFTLSFSAREIQFVFLSGIASPNSTLRGYVDCYQSASYPKDEPRYLGGFGFKPNGETDMPGPSAEDSLFLTWEEHAVYICLHFIHESLTLDKER